MDAPDGILSAIAERQDEWLSLAVFGPTPYGMGAADEHVTVADYLDTVRVHALTALQFLG